MSKEHHSKEHILACLSTSPSNAKIIRTAAQMAHAFDGHFTALYVKTPTSDKLGKKSHERLEKHFQLAEELGAEISTIYGEDIPQQITEFTRLSHVTKIVLGQSNIEKNTLFHKQSLTDKLIRSAPELDIHIIPDAENEPKYTFSETLKELAIPTAKNICFTAGILALSTALGFLFHSLHFTGANTITLYIMGALLTSLFTKNYICSIAFSFISVFLFNFLFTEPRLSLIAYESGYPITLAIMLIASLITGTLANKLSVNAKLSAHTAYRTSILLETNQLLQKADNTNAMLRTLAEQISKLLARNVIIYPATRDGLGPGILFPTVNNNNDKALLTPQEQATARWVFQNGMRAGAFSDNKKDSLGQYFAIKANDDVFCVVGIQVGTKNMEPFENSILNSLLGECALAIENIHNAKEKEHVALLAQNEQLRSDLLRSISHDLRTPLTSISGNTENLLINFNQIDEATRKQLLTDIYDDSQWLINLVENLLSITRISEGRMNMHISAQLVDEVIAEALRHITRKGASHNITTDLGNALLLANMDARLIIQVIINLVDNAIKYTPSGSEIKITAQSHGNTISISVADNGPGIPDNQKATIFKMFYTGEHKVVDCRRSLGLGLSLCESIINAHGGEIKVTDNQPHGCIFTFTLKASEVNLNE